jgi:hypothetical protein
MDQVVAQALATYQKIAGVASDGSHSTTAPLAG